jgi:hypothetical protein
MSASSKLKLVIAVVFASSQSVLGAYNLVKDYSGPSFFDNWAYYGAADNLTSGEYTLKLTREVVG